MKRLFFFLLSAIISTLTFSQSNGADSAFYMKDSHLFANKCAFEIGQKLGVNVFIIPHFCYALPEFSSDSIEMKNAALHERYALRLGENWQEKIRTEIAACETNTCSENPSPDIARLGYFLLTPMSDTFSNAQICHLINSIQWILDSQAQTKIELALCSLPMEDSLNLKRMASLRFLFKSHNMSESSYTLTDLGSSQPIKPNLPNDPENCRIMIFIQVDPKK